MRITKILGFTVLCLVCLLHGTVARAGVVGSYGKVASLRVEGSYGFIGVSAVFEGGSPCNSRVWLDITSASGRAVYATAMLAYQNKQEIWIRANEDAPKVFGACALHDIYAQ